MHWIHQFYKRNRNINKHFENLPYKKMYRKYSYDDKKKWKPRCEFVGCQSWIIGPRLALWQSTSATKDVPDRRLNYGQDCNRLSGQPWRITLDDRDISVGPPLSHG